MNQSIEPDLPSAGAAGLDTQPLDAVMSRLGLSNADLVRASTDQLSFKMVQKGRKGRRLSRNVQRKILKALAAVRPDAGLTLADLFNY